MRISDGAAISPDYICVELSRRKRDSFVCVPIKFAISARTADEKETRALGIGRIDPDFQRIAHPSSLGIELRYFGTKNCSVYPPKKRYSLKSLPMYCM
jgi:hypothetical protein